MSEETQIPRAALTHDAQGKALYVDTWEGECEVHGTSVRSGGSCPRCLADEYEKNLPKYQQCLLIRRRSTDEEFLFSSMLTFLPIAAVDSAQGRFVTLKGSEGEWKIQLRYESELRALAGLINEGILYHEVEKVVS